MVVAEDTLTAPSPPPPTRKPTTTSTTIPTQPTPDVGANYYPRSSTEVVFVKAFFRSFAVTPAAFSLLQCIYLTLRKPFKDFRIDFSVRILKMRFPRDQRSKYCLGIFMYPLIFFEFLWLCCYSCQYNVFSTPAF